MSPKKISKVYGIHRLGAKGSAMDGPYGKLKGNSRALAKEISIKKAEEASSWQDKMKESHLNYILLRSEILQKRTKRQNAT